MPDPSSIRRDWDRMARLYHDFAAGPNSYSRQIEQPALRGLLGSLAGLRVLDAGCGSGLSTFFLESLGPAELSGLELSEEMLAIAQSEADQNGSAARFLHGDAFTLMSIADRSIDLLFASGLTHYFPHLEPFFQACRRVLVPGGRAVLSIIHPVYTAQYPLFQSPEHLPADEEWQVRYLDRGLRAYVQPWVEFSDLEPFVVTSYHHTLGDYVAALTAAGFRLDAFVEPLPPPEFAERFPSRYNAYMATPTFAILDLRRDDAP
jgi:SAM-dependent methyltransferase